MKHSKTVRGICLIALSINMVFVCSAVAEEAQIGKVVAVRGDVFAEDMNGKARSLAIKNPLYVGDTVKTGSRSRIQMMFSDNTLISLGQQTEMKLSEYVWQPENDIGKMTTQVKEGAFRIMGGAITRIAPKKFKTETPSATIGIRGSMYAGKVKGMRLSVLFEGGKGIEVINRAGAVVITRPGFGTIVRTLDQAPEEPVRFSGEDLAEINEAFMDEPEPSDEQSDEQNEEKSQKKRKKDKRTERPKSTDDLDPSPLRETPGELDQRNKPIEDARKNNVEEVQIERLSLIEREVLKLLAELGFSGGRSHSVIRQGIEGYEGVVSIKGDEDDKILKGGINWHNGRFMGVVEDDDALDSKTTAFFFGEISGTSLSNLQIIGLGFEEDTGRVTTLSGGETFGQLYGEQNEAFGLAIEGIEVNVRDQSDLESWSGIGIGLRTSEVLSDVPSGTSLWNGFVVGLGEDMNRPDVDEKLFMNSSSSEFQLTVNKDQGTINGSLSAEDVYGSDMFINSLTVGGPSTSSSAYIDDMSMIALLSGGSAITDAAGNTSGLKTYGNYILTSGPEDETSEYLSWGYWEIAYEEPETGKDYHVHIPGAMWVAGEQTPESVIQGLSANGVTGTYQGGATGVRIDPSGRMSDLTGGITDLTIDFDPSALSPVFGNISFDQVVLEVGRDPGELFSTGFTVPIADATSSSVNGTFFGPNAEAIGGNFFADMMSGERYHGLFGGERTDISSIMGP